MVAGKATKSNVIGMVGGYAIPEVNRLMQAFMDGAKSVNPNVKFIVSFINSWYDPPKAKEAAFAMIDKGADVLYAERFGVVGRGQGAQASRPSATSSTRRRTIPARRRLGAVAHGADDRPRHQGGQGRHLRGGDYGPFSCMAQWRRQPRAARHEAWCRPT